ncbi:MAG: putative sugar kinase YdjH [Calditrichaeota bacterium]|nr:putative sugar kinase YdjH [Calditrichota bacterium]
MGEGGRPILVVGSAALDTLHTPAGSEEDVLGGSSFYFSAAASLFAPVRLVAVVGTDFPREQLEFMNGRRVDLSGLEVADGETFRWGGRYGEDPNQRETLFTRLGVFARFEPKIPAHFRDTPLVFLGNIHPNLQLRVLEQIERPELVVLDTMNFWIHGTPDELREVISRCNILIVNDEEAGELTGRVHLFDAAQELLAGGLEALVVKKGRHGAILFRRNERPFFVPAYPVPVVKDPTGAGDTFAGGFLGYLAHGEASDPAEWRRAVVHGTVTASATVEDFSLRGILALKPADVDLRVGELREMTRF